MVAALRPVLERRLGKVTAEQLADELRTAPTIAPVLGPLAAEWIVDAAADAAPVLLLIGEGRAFWLALANRLVAAPSVPWREAGFRAFICPDAARDPLVNARIGEILSDEGRWELLIALLAIGDPHGLLPEVLSQYLTLADVKRATAILAVSAIARADRRALGGLADALSRHGLTVEAAAAEGAAVSDDLE